MSPPQLPDPEILPVAPPPLSLNVPEGPDVFVLTFLVIPSESLNVPVLIDESMWVTDPGVPAVLFLNGPCTPPPVPEEPPPPVNLNISPVTAP